MLGPCLADETHEANELLFDHYKSALPFPKGPPADGSNSSFRSKPRHELLVLVDSNEPEALGRYVGALLRHVVDWHPRVVTLWDWRLLQYKLPQPMREEHRKELVHKFFFAKMWWDPLAKEAKGQGAVVLKWCAGKPWLVLKQELDEMGWVDPI